MSPHLYRHLMREKVARLRQPAGAPLSHTRGNHGRLSALNPIPAVRPRYAR
jgi:hypothetical protein